MKKALHVTIAILLTIPLLLCSCQERHFVDAGDSKPIADVSFYNEILQDYATVIAFQLSETFEDSWNNGYFPTVSTDFTLAIQENSDAKNQTRTSVVYH